MEIDEEKPTCVVLYMAVSLIMYQKVAPSFFTVKIKTLR